jgi:arginyl-tRNA synthetase
VISADVRRAAWYAARGAVAARELPGPIPPDGGGDRGAADTSTLRPGRPGEYVSTLPYLVATPAAPPARVAAVLAARLAGLPWIETAAATAGHLTLTVTAEALAAVAVRTAQAPDPARSDILRGMRAAAPPPADLASAPSWQQAHAQITAEVTARLAATAGAIIFPERLPPHQSARTAAEQPAPAPGSAGRDPAPGPQSPPRFRGSAGTGPVAAALAYAGGDAVRYALVRRVRGWPPGATADVPVRYHPGNPVYAVRYAHAHAASTLRQAADLGLGVGEAAGFMPCLLAHPAERALLGALSWLPERVAWAARAARPAEFARYLEELAGAYQDCREARPALPFGGRGAPEDQAATRTRLWLVTAAAAGIAAGLRLLGVSAPDRL